MAVTVAAMAVQRGLFSVVVLFGIYSFLMATVLVALDAVDVAMTEAAVGAGVSTVLMLGALIMQSIDSGMLLLDVAIGWRYVIIGQVLIVAVVFDVVYRRLTGDTA